MNRPSRLAQVFISQSGRSRLAALTAPLTLALSVACGGAETKPNAAGLDSPAASDRVASEPREEAPVEAPRPAVDCSQGDCMSCGDTFCPSGSICDLSEGGKGKCLWLSDCAAEPSCSCVAKALGQKLECVASPAGLTVR